MILLIAATVLDFCASPPPPPPLLLLLLWSTTVSALPTAADQPPIWYFHISNDPAPAPEDGPPLSASAVRDRNHLPLEIGSILGSYALAIIAISALLWALSRRYRRFIPTGSRLMPMEMFNPRQSADDNMLAATTTTFAPSPADAWGPSPVSPGSTKREWTSPISLKSATWGRHKGRKSQVSIASNQSVVTFNGSVLEEDRAKNEIEMDRLYAAVAEHDEHRARSTTEPQHPPELQHLRIGPAPPPTRPTPASPPLSPTKSTHQRPLTVEPATPSRPKNTRPSPISITGPTIHSSASSRTSVGSYGRSRSIRTLPISPPMGSPDMVPENMRQYGEAEPLSPRIYAPGPPPTPPSRQNSSTSPRSLHHFDVPTSRRFHFAPNIRSSRLPPTNPDADSSAPPTPRAPNNPTFQFTTPDTDPSSPPPPPHHPPPQTLTIDPPHEAKPTTPKSQRTKPRPLHLVTTSSTAASESQRSLPLPLLASAPLPLRNHHHPSSGGDRPVSMIKATVLEHRVGKGGGLRAPGTGVPATPYSPYMPFTPLTPMTPSRLVTREERKRREREEGRRVVTVEDRVDEEGDMWGDGYR